MNKHNNKRVMLIVWWWNYGGMQGTSDEWQVFGPSLGDKVLRVDLRFSASAKSIIAEKASACLSDSDVFIFLHRNHGYNSQAVEDILNEIKTKNPTVSNVRCFLFGEGNGSLYISATPRGLLGTKGTFKAQRINGTTQFINAAEDEDARLLKKQHFDFVWNAYEKVFKAKVFELQEDLFTTLSPFLLQKKHQAGELYSFLRSPEKELLFLRLLSFTGKLRKGSAQEKKLFVFEERLDRALHFDDFNSNLQNVYGESPNRIYETLNNEITNKLFNSREEVNLIQLRDQFSALLVAMPEEVYN